MKIDDPNDEITEEDIIMIYDHFSDDKGLYNDIIGILIGYIKLPNNKKIWWPEYVDYEFIN
jgi:hypothetical protein